MTQIIPIPYDEYNNATLGGDPCVMDVNRSGCTNVGDIIGRDGDECEILNIYVHHESECTWMVMKHMKSGQLFEQDLAYTQDVGI